MVSGGWRTGSPTAHTWRRRVERDGHRSYVGHQRRPASLRSGESTSRGGVDRREWLPDDHVVCCSTLSITWTGAVWKGAMRSAGVGRRAYDSRMMLALLIYAYAD